MLPITRTRSLPLAALAAVPLVALITACDDPVNPLKGVRPVPESQEASAIIGPGGGALTLASSDGAQFELSVPAGALDSTVTITMFTTAATRAQRFQLRFAPAGLVFNERATVHVSLPPKNGAAVTASLVYDAAPLVTQTGTDGVFHGSIRGFAVGGSAQLADPGPSPAPQPRTTPPPAPCEEHIDVEEYVYGALTVAEDLGPGRLGLCSMQHSWALRRNATFYNALRLADATDAYLARGIDGNAGALAYIRTEACSGLTEAVTALEAAPLNGYGLVLPPMQRVLFWMQQVSRVGGDCNALTAAHAALDDAVYVVADFYASRIGMASSTASTDYLLAIADAAEATRIVPRLRAVGAAPSIRELAAYMVTSIIQPAQLYAMLPVAYGACFDFGDPGELMRWRRFMGPVPSLRSAIQYCGTRLTVESRDSTGALIDSIVTPMGGTESPVAPITLDTIDARPNGTLRLLGPIRALPCPAGTFGPEDLVIGFSGIPTHVLTTAPYFAQAQTFDLAQMRVTAGIAPGDLTARQMSLHRGLEPCNDAWGPVPDPMLVIVVRFVP